MAKRQDTKQYTDRDHNSILADFIKDIKFLSYTLENKGVIYSEQYQEAYGRQISTTIRRIVENTINKALKINKKIFFNIPESHTIPRPSLNYVGECPLVFLDYNTKRLLFLPEFLMNSNACPDDSMQIDNPRIELEDSKQTLNNTPRQYRLDDWWNRLYVLKVENEYYTRRQVVYDFVANKRGAHTDLKIEYSPFWKNLDLGNMGIVSELPTSHIAYAITIQVAYELYNACSVYLKNHDTTNTGAPGGI